MMMNETSSYTIEEVAGLLKVSKLTVYDLIKKGVLLLIVSEGRCVWMKKI